MEELDPGALGNNEKVNSYYLKAMEFCRREMVDSYNNYTNVNLQHANQSIGTNIVPQHGWFDIAHPKADPFPEPCKSSQISQELKMTEFGRSLWISPTILGTRRLRRTRQLQRTEYCSRRSILRRWRFSPPKQPRGHRLPARQRRQSSISIRRPRLRVQLDRWRGSLNGC